MNIYNIHVSIPTVPIYFLWKKFSCISEFLQMSTKMLLEGFFRTVYRYNAIIHGLDLMNLFC